MPSVKDNDFGLIRLKRSLACRAAVDGCAGGRAVRGSAPEPPQFERMRAASSEGADPCLTGGSASGEIAVPHLEDRAPFRWFRHGSPSPVAIRQRIGRSFFVRSFFSSPNCWQHRCAKLRGLGQSPKTTYAKTG